MRTLTVAGLVVVIQVYCLCASPSLPREEKDIEIWQVQDEEEGNLGLSDREILIRDAIVEALENLKLGMETGFEELGIPPLDPLVLPADIPFNITFDDNMVYGNLTDSELINLSHFLISKILVNIQFALMVDFGLETENWELHGAYNMGGQALGMDVFGSGNYHMTLNNVRFGLSTYISLGHWGKYVEMYELTGDLMMDDADVQFEHLLGGGVIGALVNQALSAELPVVLKALEDVVVPPLFEVIRNKTNEVLRNYPIYPDFNITDVGEEGRHEDQVFSYYW